MILESHHSKVGFSDVWEIQFLYKFSAPVPGKLEHLVDIVNKKNWDSENKAFFFCTHKYRLNSPKKYAFKKE